MNKSPLYGYQSHYTVQEGGSNRHFCMESRHFCICRRRNPLNARKNRLFKEKTVFSGSRRRIRTLTNRVRVCRATFTQFGYLLSFAVVFDVLSLTTCLVYIRNPISSTLFSKIFEKTFRGGKPPVFTADVPRARVPRGASPRPVSRCAKHSCGRCRAALRSRAAAGERPARCRTAAG